MDKKEIILTHSQWVYITKILQRALKNDLNLLIIQILSIHLRFYVSISVYLCYIVFLNTLVYEKISIFQFFTVITIRIIIIASETFISKVFKVEVRDFVVIKIFPFAVLDSYVGCIVTGFRDTVMDDHSFEFVLILLCWQSFLVFV